MILDLMVTINRATATDTVKGTGNPSASTVVVVVAVVFAVWVQRSLERAAVNHRSPRHRHYHRRSRCRRKTSNIAGWPSKGPLPLL